MHAERQAALRHFKKADPVMHSIAKRTDVQLAKARRTRSKRSPASGRHIALMHPAFYGKVLKPDAMR